MNGEEGAELQMTNHEELGDFFLVTDITADCVADFRRWTPSRKFY